MRSPLKWQILWRVLPLTALFCGVKLSFHSLHWEPWAFDALTGSLFGSATFVIALVLGGTLSDYRTSEAIPTQIANALETIHDSNLMLAAGHGEYDPQPLRQALVQIAKSTVDWLVEEKSLEAVQEAIAHLNPLFVPLAQLGGAAIANRVHAEQAKVRLLIAQIEGNRDTDFLAPAYVLLWVFLIGSVTALLLIGADRFSENLTVSAFLFTSFTYLLILIRDLDNPFQYSGRSSVDVDLSPLKRVGDRL